jgi:uracil-DNA glycosylase
MDKAAELKEIADEIALYPLYATATNPVPGEGNPDAEIVFVGEAPGFHEDKQGRPFVGAAGQFLDAMLHSINLERNDVFITNVVKYRPPANRDPEKGEIASSYRWLKQQIDIINPKLVVTLGRHSMSVFLPEVGKISEVHGRAYRKPDGRVYVPFFHPAAGLHQASLKSVIEADFKKLPKIIALTK